MRKWRLLLLLGLALAVSGGLAGCIEGGVTFADSRVELAIRAAIDKPAGDIRPSDLEDLTSLSAERRGITDLGGLQYCTNLTTLDLSDNEIADISPLLSLSKLRTVTLNGNPLSADSLDVHVPGLRGRGVLVSLGTDPGGNAIYERDLDRLNQFIALEPDAAVVYFIRARFYARAEEWENAAADCKTALEIGAVTEVCQEYYECGVAYEAVGWIDEAIAAFEKCLSIARHEGEEEAVVERCKEGARLRIAELTR